MHLTCRKAAQAVCSAFALFLVFSTSTASAQQGGDSAQQALVQLLKEKGILTADDVARIKQAGSGQQVTLSLARILLSKGVISQSDYDRLVGTDPAPATAQMAEPSHPAVLRKAVITTHVPAANVRANVQQPPGPTEPGVPSLVERVPSQTINQALTPVRVFPVGAVKLDGHPSFRADGVGVTPYGFIKTTVIHDSSSPNGDDFPLPGFITDTGPNGSPEFHVKVRSSRFGADFSWYDSNPKWLLTGRVEADFEGNFNRSDNRNLSSVRSNNPSLRLAWARMDYRFNAANAFSALFGQDFTIYGSSTLPNMLETTGLGVGFGSLYTRDPQVRVGFTHTSGGLTLMPELAINLPASGLAPSAAFVSNELGYGERQGPDSDRPNVQGRLVGQWQLDHAPGVPAAQLIVSGFEGKRTATVLASGVPTDYQAAFPTGANASSKQDGWDAEWQLPTRWFTLAGKVYSGSDLRWFFAGQFYSYFNDTAGLTNTVTVTSQDGGSSLVFGTNASEQQIVAPERPVRAAGGFTQLGLPLSRIFNANPAGRNAGWSLYFLYGEDQAKARDADRMGGTRHQSSMTLGTLNYKFNRWLSFSYEQSIFATHANPELPLPLFKGVPSKEWKDVREEGGPIFFF